MAKKNTKHRVIHLHVYKGHQGSKGLLRDENNKVININNRVKLTHNTKEWDDYLSRLRVNGFIKVDILGYLDEVLEDGTFTYLEVEESVEKEVRIALHGNNEVKLTPEQKELKELKEQLSEMKALMGNAKAPKKEKEVDSELSEARAKYLEVFGEKGNKLWKTETILNKIEEKLNN